MGMQNRLAGYRILLKEAIKLIRYAQIDLDTGMVVSDSYLSGEVEAENMIQIEEDFDLTNKRYVDGNWIEYVPNENETENNNNETEISDAELIQAEMLLNQESIIAKQKEHDEILAELLLGQQKGA